MNEKKKAYLDGAGGKAASSVLTSHFDGAQHTPSGPQVGMCVFPSSAILPLDCLWPGGFEKPPLRSSGLWVEVNEDPSLYKPTLGSGTFWGVMMGGPVIVLLDPHGSPGPCPGDSAGCSRGPFLYMGHCVTSLEDSYGGNSACRVWRLQDEGAGGGREWRKPWELVGEVRCTDMEKNIKAPLAKLLVVTLADGARRHFARACG